MDKEKLKYFQKRCRTKSKDLKYDFMPGLIEIIEKPANKGGYIIIWLITAFLVGSIVWASLSKVDVVINMDGLVYPEENVKLIQSNIAGNISKLYVKDGDKVKKDDILIEIDSENLKNSISSLNSQIEIKQVEYDLYSYLLEKKDIDNIDLSKYKGEIKTYAKTILAEERKINNVVSEYKDKGLEFEQFEKEHYEQILNTFSTLGQEIRSLNLQLNNTNQALELGKIRAVSDGIVSGISQISDKSMVMQGQELMEIVPVSDNFIVQGYISNANIADVKVGSSVKVKLTAYPYSDFGMLEGKITSIDATSKSKEEIGVVYPVEIKLINDKNSKIKLKSGMTANAEVSVGKRRIIEYVLEPIIEAIRKSAKEK